MAPNRHPGLLERITTPDRYTVNTSNDPVVWCNSSSQAISTRRPAIEACEVPILDDWLLSDHPLDLRRRAAIRGQPGTMVRRST